MTPQELTKRGIEAYVGQSFPRATCLFLMALLAERDVDATLFDTLKEYDLKSPEEKK